MKPDIMVVYEARLKKLCAPPLYWSSLYTQKYLLMC